MGRRLGMMRIFSWSGSECGRELRHVARPGYCGDRNSRRLGKLLRVVGIFCWGALGEFALDFAEPSQLGFELVEHQRDDPCGLVIEMADFGED